MKRLLFCLALGIFSLGYGQGNDKILKVTYTHHVLLSKKGDFDTVLYADDTHSQFVFDQKPKSFKTDEGYDMTFPSEYYISDYNFQTQYIHDNRLLNEVMLSSQWENDLVWQITDEEKEIAGYKVRKATADSYGDKGFEFYKGKVIAWFTTDIPIPTGPQRYYGLPGLIVELYYERTREGYSLKKVEQVSKEDYTFVPLTDENAIGKDEMIYNYLRSKEVKAILKAAKKKKK